MRILGPRASRPHCVALDEPCARDARGRRRMRRTSTSSIFGTVTYAAPRHPRMNIVPRSRSVQSRPQILAMRVSESERKLLPISKGARSLSVAALTIPIFGAVPHPAPRDPYA